MISEKLSSQLKAKLREMLRISDLEQAEIAGYFCVKDDEIVSMKIMSIGDAKSTSFDFGKVCPKGTIQFSFHTHPAVGGGVPDFSKTDIKTINSRLEYGIDDASCMVSDVGIICRISRLD